MSGLNASAAPDPVLEEALRILGDPSYSDNPLLGPYREMVELYVRTQRTFMKTVRISDHYQLRLKELNAALDEARRTDYLTKLMNRRAFYEALGLERSRSRRHGRPLCVLMADIDEFKRVNDRFGHDVGDAVLAQTAQIITSSLREEDLIARWGGEEFLILLPETDLAGGERAAEKLRKLVEAASVGAQGETVRVTLSIGVAEERSGDVEAAMRSADLALLDAKRAGRNRVALSGDPS